MQPVDAPPRSRPRAAALLPASLLAPGLASLLSRAYLRALLLFIALHLTPQLLALEARGMLHGLYALLAAHLALALLDSTLSLRGARAHALVCRPLLVAPLVVLANGALLALNAWHFAPIMPFQVPSPSMAPALKTGDFFMVEKQRWPARALSRGDIVVFTQRMGSQEQVAVKRVIALGGEQVNACGQPVRVDGAALEEPYLHYRARPQHPPPHPHCAMRVPKDHVYVLGDYRGYSTDSRALGPVPLADVVGRALYIFDARSPDRVGRTLLAGER